MRPPDNQTGHDLEFDDDEKGIAEALRRDAELDAHPELGISIEQFDQHIRAHERICKPH